MFKKILSIILLIAVCTICITKSINAITTEEKEELNKQVEEITQKLTELGKAKNTLANQLKQIDYQANLTQLKITQTEKNVKTLETDIESLTLNINNLDINLNQLSSVFIYQIVQNYKLEKRIPKFSIFTTNNFNDFLNQYKYASTIQKDSQNTLMKMETTRTTFDMQKTEKENKQKELETLQVSLAKQKTNLAKQQTTKNKLLEDTKNDEKTYAARLAAVQSKLSSFANTSAQCLSSNAGPGNDGYYFSQIDPRWCSQIPAGTEGCKVGNTNKPCTVGYIGCYITSTTMVLKKLGVDTDPRSYASDINHMESNADMKAIDVPSGYKYCRYSSSQANMYKVIDNELNNKPESRYVIAQVPMSPYHFIVLTSGSNGSYMMHDPWRGSDLNFNKYYNTILSIRLVTKNTCP